LIFWAAITFLKNGAEQLVPSYEGFIVLQVAQANEPITECLGVTGKDGLLEVFVSAVVHPGRFWVQVSNDILDFKLSPCCECCMFSSG
jgi:hypothetical protein